MANFFSDAFNAITAQQTTPKQTIIPTSDLLNQTYSTLQGQIPNLTAYNNALVGATVPSQLAAESLYDPNIANIRAAAGKSILDQLNLGSALPEDLQQQVIQNALEGNAATGFGVGTGGRGLVARDLGLTGLDLLNRRQDAARTYASNNTGLSLFNPSTGFSPGAISQDIRGIQAAKDEYENMAEDIRRQNFSALLNTGGRILGTVVGGIYGGAAGAQMGGQIGGSLVKGSRVAGQQKNDAQTSGGGGGMSSLMGMSGGGGGGGGGGGSSGGGASFNNSGYSSSYPSDYGMGSSSSLSY